MFCWQSEVFSLLFLSCVRYSRTTSNPLPSIHTTDSSCRCRWLFRQPLLLQFPALTPVIVRTISGERLAQNAILLQKLTHPQLRNPDRPIIVGRQTTGHQSSNEASAWTSTDRQPILHWPKPCSTRPRSSVPILCPTRRMRESHAIARTAQTRHAPDGGDGYKVHRAGGDTQPSLLVLDYCSSTVPLKY